MTNKTEHMLFRHCWNDREHQRKFQKMCRKLKVLMAKSDSDTTKCEIKRTFSFSCQAIMYLTVRAEKAIVMWRHAIRKYARDCVTWWTAGVFKPGHVKFLEVISCHYTYIQACAQKNLEYSKSVLWSRRDVSSKL